MRVVKTLFTLLVLSSQPAVAQPPDSNPQQIYERLSPTVVFVAATPDHGTGMGGTGTIIRSDGLILTNAHVVLDSANKPYSQISVFLKPDRVTGNPKTDLSRRFAARVVSINEPLDLALLQAQQTPPLPAISFGDPTAVHIGDRVLAIGHPEQGGMWTLTAGLISAEFDNFNGTPGKHVFQTDTGLNRGNSGGPLLDGHGRMIGINTAMARMAKDGTPIMSINFAVESSVALKWLRTQGVTIGAPDLPRDPKLSGAPTPLSQSTNQVVPPVAAPAKPVPSSPQIKTDPHPFNMDQVLESTRNKQLKEMEDIISESREKMKTYR